MHTSSATGPLAVVLLILSTTGWAAPIEYKWTGAINGTIGSSSFIGAEFSFNVTADTARASAFTNQSTSGYQNFVFPGFLGTAAVTIAGIGTANILEGLLIVANPNDYCQCVGITFADRSKPSDILDLFQTSLTLANPYNLKTSVGPVPGSIVTFPSIALPVSTSLGLLLISSGSMGVFQATVVPVPAAAWLFGSALGAMGVIRRKTHQLSSANRLRHRAPALETV